MAETETESKLDELEMDGLQKAISQAELVLADALPGAKALLANFVQNAKARVGALDRKIKDYQIEQEHAREDAVTVRLAAMESNLNESERETFSGFLRKGFFTKGDFGALEQFYSKTWDRLSERGKDEMSHRIWEGIRHNEYTFAELPETVREKEARRAYSALAKRDAGTEAIPAKDREEFCRAFEQGHRKEAENVLERESFKKSMFLVGESKRIEHGTVESGREKEAAAIANRIGERTPQSETPAQQASQEEVTTLRRKGVSLKTAEGEVSSSSIPVHGTPAQKQSPSLPS
jgi:hypothetical protein